MGYRYNEDYLVVIIKNFVIIQMERILLIGIRLVLYNFIYIYYAFRTLILQSQIIEQWFLEVEDGFISEYIVIGGVSILLLYKVVILDINYIMYILKYKILNIFIIKKKMLEEIGMFNMI